MAGLEDRLRKLIVFASFGAGCLGQQDDTRDSVVDTNETGQVIEGTSPEIISTLSGTAYVGQQFSYTLEAEPAADLTCDFAFNELESYVQKDDCRFSIMPDDNLIGDHTLTLYANNEFGQDTEQYLLTIVAQQQNSAPVIATTSLPNATTQTVYSASITATDPDGDRLTYSLTDSPSWLVINSSSGSLSGTPTRSGTETVEVLVSDGEFSTTHSYNLEINSIATLDMEVIDGDSGGGVEDSCNVPVTLTNASSGYSETVTAIDGYATFNLDETGAHNISVASTNTGSNCYGGFAQDEWLDVSSGSNISWVHLIPEDRQSEVQSVVGSQLDMGDVYGHAAGNVDSVRDLVVYMVEVDSRVPESYGWDSSIRTGLSNLEVEDFNGAVYSGIDYDSALSDTVSYWNGYLAPSMSIVSSGSGGDIYWTVSGNWQTDVNMSESSGIWTIDDVEISYGSVGSYEGAVTLMSHEIGHSFFNHTNVDVFIMNQAPSADEPYELELFVARTFNNIGYESPNYQPINLFSGYTE